MISSFAKIFRLLSSDIEPYQLSLGISLGFVAGLSPFISIQSLMVFILLIILRANISMFFISFGLISIVAYLADPLLVYIGQLVLINPGLNPMFTEMYNNGFWRVLSFNNTVAMGSLLLSVILFIPLFLLFNFLIKKYRNAIEKHWKNSRIFNYIKSSKLLGKMASITEKVS
ncbi:MAG: TIGR03546 family protein [Gammaproteobacteria bacterium]|nr:TIGR03546 family protein [Gammaproteobacteria bacterium]